MSESKGVESKVREIRRKTRRKYSAEEKIRIVLEGLKGEDSIAALCRREGISPNLYYIWSKEFLEAGKRRLVGDTKRQAGLLDALTLSVKNFRLSKHPDDPLRTVSTLRHPTLLLLPVRAPF